MFTTTTNASLQGIIIVNNNGQARICKFFQPVHQEGFSAEDAQQQVVRKVFQQVAQRPDRSALLTKKKHESYYF